MKINMGLGAIFGAEKLAEAKDRKKAAKLSTNPKDKFDNVEFSNNFLECLDIAEEIKEEVNQVASEEKINSLKNQIESGQYVVDCAKLAADMINLA